ncbi:hypothetical protein ACIO3O_27605 [Streptomyces sp. NPDC087440]|uniref:hypothetical protein n=1 Tax=Streptomyces sp. NPDC087440 TaxID=3365790 RepID=UPI0037F6C71E
MRQRSTPLAVPPLSRRSAARWSAVAATLLLGVAATACAGPEPAPGRTLSASAPLPDLPGTPTPTRLSLTRDDSGRTLTLMTGGVALLRLTGPDSGEATADGPAVTVVPVAYETDPGYREWEIRAARAGTAVVRAGGGTRQVHITFKVVSPTAPAGAR